MAEKIKKPIIQWEWEIVQIMIDIFYKNKKNNQNSEIIPQLEMENYVHQRLLHCHFGNQKPTCQTCSIHCYQSKYQQQMKQVMRYSGPRILFYHPIVFIKHCWRNFYSYK